MSTIKVTKYGTSRGRLYDTKAEADAEDIKDRIYDALEAKGFTWRVAEGVANEWSTVLAAITSVVGGKKK